jgi:hypothetical protein
MTTFKFDPAALALAAKAAGHPIPAAPDAPAPAAPVLINDGIEPSPFADDPAPAPWYRKVLNVLKGVTVFVASEGKVLMSLAAVGVGGLLDQFDVVDVINYAKGFFGEGTKTGGIIAGIVVVFFVVKFMTKFVINKGKTNARGVDEGE